MRQFLDTPLSDVSVHAILNAGRRAQSAKNTQPWHFIAIRERTILTQLSEMGDWAGHLAGAALAIAIITPDPELRFNIMFDAGQSAAYMQLAAWEMGIGSCLATIYEPEKIHVLLGFPHNLHSRVAISFGYPSEAIQITLPPKKGGRWPFNDTVHWDKW